MDKKTLQQMIVDIYETSEKMSEQVIADKLTKPNDKVNRVMVSRWRMGVTPETKHKRHERVIALHKRVMRRHKRTNLND